MKSTLLIILAVLIVGTASTVQATENNEAQKLSRKELKQQQINKALDIIKSGQFRIIIDFENYNRDASYGVRTFGSHDVVFGSQFGQYGRPANITTLSSTVSYDKSFSLLLTIDLSNDAHKCDTTYFDQKTNTYIFKYSKNIDSETYYFTVKINKKGRVNVYYDDPQGDHIRALEPSDCLGVIPLESKS